MEDQGQGLLEFGTSVSVNEEIRRTIASEIEETQESIQKIKDEIALGTKVGKELRKSRSNAAAETRDLRQGSKEALERLSIMHYDVFHDLNHNTLRKELCVLSEEREPEPMDTEEDAVPPSGDDKKDGNDGEKANENSPPPPEVNPHSMQGIQQRHDDIASSLWKIGAHIQEMEEAFVNKKSQYQSIVEKKEQTAQQVRSFESELSKTQLTTENFTKNYNAEEGRVRTLEGKIRDLKESYEKIMKEAAEKVSSCSVSSPIYQHSLF